MEEIVSKKRAHLLFAKVFVMPSLHDLVESDDFEKYEIKLSRYALKLSDDEFRSDLALLFHASLYDLISNEIYSLARDRTENFITSLVSDLASLSAGNFEFRTRSLQRKIRRLVLDAFLFKPSSSKSQSLGVDELSASIRSLMKRWQHNYRTSDTRSCSAAQKKMKKQFYGKIHLVEDLLTLRFSKTRHAEFRRFIQKDVLKFDRTISLIRGGKTPSLHDNTDIESFLKSYRRSKAQRPK